MTASPALQAAIRAGCLLKSRCGVKEGACQKVLCNGDNAVIIDALRSLATPTPEVVAAMVKASCGIGRHPQHECGFPVCGDLCTVKAAKARAALTAYWSSVLGEKPAELGAVPVTQGVEP